MENTISDFNNFMTIYYVKRTGKIKMIVDGKRDMTIFGDDEIENSLIWNFITIDKDEYVMRNSNQFIVDLASSKLIYIPSVNISKYSTINND